MRRLLVWLVLGTLLPFVVLLGAMVYVQYHDARESAAHQVQDVARGMALALEHQLHATVASLQALAGSSSLANGDLAAFRREAEALAGRHFPGATVTLLELDGRQVFNTVAPPGTVLPRRPNLESLERVKATGQPAVSSLFPVTMRDTPIAPVDVPVFGPDGSVRAVLSLKPPLTTFADLIYRQRLQPGWLVAVLDRNDAVVARLPSPERYVGSPAAAGLREGLARSPEGTADMVSLEGVPTLAGWSRPGPSGWAVSVAIPRSQLYVQPARVALSAVVAFLLTLAGALLLARSFARRIAQPIQALTRLAAQPAGAQDMPVPRLGLHEAETVAAALQTALRNAHESERRARRVEAESRTELEGRVAARTRELEAAQAQLLQAQRLEAVGHLTAGVAHDFNNLLQAMMAGLELLLDEVKDQNHARHYAEMALETSQKGARLTHSLLSFSRQQVLRPTPVAMPELLGRLRELLSRTLDPRITVQIAIGPGIGCPMADLGQLEAALLNLCLNGRDAMQHAGGHLIIEAFDGADVPEPPPTVEPAQCVVIAVSDEGCGMDEATLARACEPFFTTKSVGRGSGLGLPMVQGFTRQSGGDMRLESAPGVGTRVELWLPLAAAWANPQAELPPAPTPAPTCKPMRSGRILLVDDDTSVLELLGDVLEDAGFAVERRPSGEEAMAVIQSADPVDMLVTDYAMPGMTGGELVFGAQRLRPGLPSLIITGFADQAQLGQVPPDTDILHKPFRAEELIRRVALLADPDAGRAMTQAA